MKYLGTIWLGIAFFIVGMAGYYAGERSVTVAAQQALLSANEPFTAFVRTKETECAALNGLPDPDCTPGSVFPEVIAEQTCVSGYTKTVRKVSTALKKQVYAEYGISYPQPFGSYEADHFIPLTLGGDNSIANLFPEAARPVPGFREKDLVENYLHGKVCRGEVSLAAAQRAISTNWVAVYDHITSTELADLKALYKSWSSTGD